MCFGYLNHHFVTAVAKVGYTFVSSVCEHMNYWKRVFSNCFDVPNPNIKSFLLLVEWKIIKHKTVWFFVMWTIILSFILQFTREIICTALFSILCLIDQTWLFQRLQLQLLMQNAALLLVLENVDLDLTWWFNFKKWKALHVCLIQFIWYSRFSFHCLKIKHLIKIKLS